MIAAGTPNDQSLDNAVRNSRIVLLEDDEDFVLMVQASVRKLGYGEVLAGTVTSVLPGLAEAPTLFLVDLKMPDSDGGVWDYSGLDVCAAIRSRFGEVVPIVVLTGNENPRNIIAALDIGADDYVIKDLDVDAIVRSVAGWIAAQRPAEGLGVLRRELAERLRKRLKAGDRIDYGDWRLPLGWQAVA